jgi:predicted PurR-regulated permease PerM
MLLSRRAQTFMEYVVLIGIVTAAVVYMLPRVKRTTQSMIKSAADQLGDQKGADQTFNDAEKGYLVNSVTGSRSLVNNLRVDISGSSHQTYNEVSTSTATSFLNAGWSRE